MGFFDNLLDPKRGSDTPQISKKGLGVNDLTNRGYTLDIYSMVANDSVSFSAFIDGFSDGFTSEWSPESVFGRMDPISTFMGTKRAIAVSWKVPADSLAVAKQNLYDINKLISYLYPQYAERGGACGATTINMGPLMRIKFGNLIQDAATGGGLLGYVNGITFEPVFEDGVFMLSSADAAAEISQRQQRNLMTSLAGSTVEGIGPNMDSALELGRLQTMGNDYYPKTVRLNFEFTVLHEHPMGYDQNNVFRGGLSHEMYPYDISFAPGEKPRNWAEKVKAQCDSPAAAVACAQSSAVLGSVKVRAGDTMSGLAQRHGVPLQRLLAMNPHTTNVADSRRRKGDGHWIYPGESVRLK